MNDKCYSWDEEYFHIDLDQPLERAVECFLGENPDFEGETEIELFEGEKVQRTISQFLPPLVEYISDRAYSLDDEYSENWCEKIEKNSKQIQETISAALENWANETNNQPNFFGIKNVESFSVKIKVDSEGNWEQVEL